LLDHEIRTAFFLEAAFLGIMWFGEKRERLIALRFARQSDGHSRLLANIANIATFLI
jgi:hypothetical protein